MEKKSLTFILAGILVVFILLNIVFIYEEKVTGEAFKPIRKIAPRLPAPDTSSREIVHKRIIDTKSREAACNGCFWKDKMNLKEEGFTYTFTPDDVEFKKMFFGKENGKVFEYIEAPETRCFNEDTEIYIYKYKGYLKSGLKCKDKYWQFITPLKSPCPDNGCLWDETGMMFHISEPTPKYMDFHPADVGSYDLFGIEDLELIFEPEFYDEKPSCVRGGTLENYTEASGICTRTYKGQALIAQAGLLCVNGRWWLSGGMCPLAVPSEAPPMPD
ncbi:hypothetical protein KY336_04470 [Candidatus Woesearchaeota archaeon]|nr:hypothetical protein [Candidatus Woesearchaeota archaeon]